jgi:hypothetical protein
MKEENKLDMRPRWSAEIYSRPVSERKESIFERVTIEFIYTRPKLMILQNS